MTATLRPLLRRALPAALALAGCAQVPQPPLVQQPMTARPPPEQRHTARTPGAIYQEGGRGHALFEDRRPRHERGRGGKLPEVGK